MQRLFLTDAVPATFTLASCTLLRTRVMHLVYRKIRSPIAIPARPSRG